MDIIELIFQGQLYFVNYKQLEDTKKIGSTSQLPKCKYNKLYSTVYGK